MPDIKFIPIHPKVAKLIDSRRLKSEFLDALDHTINIVKDDFEKTVRTWNDKPEFKKAGPLLTANSLQAAAYTNHEVYTYVTRGTEPHLIQPRRVPRLLFRSGYKAKTRPRVIGSRAGGRFGPTVSAKAVQHPGTEARDFDKEIARRRQKNLENLFRLAIRRSLRLT